MNDVFTKADQFSLFIETQAATHHQSIIDTVLQFCEDHKMEPIDIMPHINRSLKEKLESEFVQANMLPKRSQLHF